MFCQVFVGLAKIGDLHATPKFCTLLKLRVLFPQHSLSELLTVCYQQASASIKQMVAHTSVWSYLAIANIADPAIQIDNLNFPACASKIFRNAAC